MNCSSDSEDSSDTPLENLKDGKFAISHLPEKSKERYHKVYNQFVRWKAEKKATSFSENVLLSYFSQRAKQLKPSTLWATYSMLKGTLLARHNVNIKKYSKVAAFLRKQSKGYRSKKSRVFTAADIDNFLQNAPDDIYLVHKVVLILSVKGACRCQDLVDITIDNIEIRGNVMRVKIPDSTTKKLKSFVIKGKFYEIVKKYINLRPDDIDTKRFLLQCKENKCLKQVMGRNYISSIPKKIATFLELPNPEEYTGHCYRSTSTKLLDKSGTGLLVLKDDAAKSNDERSWDIDQTVYICGACKCRILGVRYKCIQCSDYDVCAACEARGVHALHYALRVPEHSVQGEVLRLIETIRKCLNEDSFTTTTPKVKKEIETVPYVNEETLLEIKVEMEEASDEEKKEFVVTEKYDPLSFQEEQLVPRARERPTQCTAFTRNTSSTQNATHTPHIVPTQQTCICTTYCPLIEPEKQRDLAAAHHTDAAFNFTHNIFMNSTRLYEGCSTNSPLTTDLINRKLSRKSRKRQKNTEETLNATALVNLPEQVLSGFDIKDTIKIEFDSTSSPLAGLTNRKSGKRKK